MTKSIGEMTKQNVSVSQSSPADESKTHLPAPAHVTEIRDALESLPEDERELFLEALHAVKTIRYGSIVLTVHDGQLVEINKSIRIRKNRSGPK